MEFKGRTKHGAHFVTDFPLTQQQRTDYGRDGFLLLKGLFEERAITMLRQSSKRDRKLDEHAFGRQDGEGGQVRLSLWNHPGQGIYGAFARSQRVVSVAEQLLGDEPYHYHSKMIMKDAQVGGAWAWHQDYGYWYRNGVLTPNLVSAFIAVDRSTRQNGCLQVIRGSHLCGRIDHQLTGDQAGADPERVEELLKRMEHVYIEMDPGDVLFFHSNLLHRSDRNQSDQPRWSMICCYNSRKNDPYKDSHHPRYTPIDRFDDALIATMTIDQFEDDPSDVDWLDPERDASAKSLSQDIEQDSQVDQD